MEKYIIANLEQSLCSQFKALSTSPRFNVFGLGKVKDSGK